MQKIVSVAGIAAITLLLSSCTFGKTEITQTPSDVSAPVVEVDTTTSGALSDPAFAKELNDVVDISLKNAINPTAATGETTPGTPGTPGAPDTTPLAPGVAAPTMEQPAPTMEQPAPEMPKLGE